MDGTCQMYLITLSWTSRQHGNHKALPLILFWLIAGPFFCFFKLTATQSQLTVLWDWETVIFNLWACWQTVRRMQYSFTNVSLVNLHSCITLSHENCHTTTQAQKLSARRHTWTYLELQLRLTFFHPASISSTTQPDVSGERYQLCMMCSLQLKEHHVQLSTSPC